MIWSAEELFGNYLKNKYKTSSKKNWNKILGTLKIWYLFFAIKFVIFVVSLFEIFPIQIQIWISKRPSWDPEGQKAYKKCNCMRFHLDWFRKRIQQMTYKGPSALCSDIRLWNLFSRLLSEKIHAKMGAGGRKFHYNYRTMLA